MAAMARAQRGTIARYCFESRRGKEAESELIRLKLASSLIFFIVYAIFNVVSCAIVRAIPILGDLPIWISEIERTQSQKCGFLEQRAKQFFGRLGGEEGNCLSAIVAAMPKTTFLHGQIPKDQP